MLNLAQEFKELQHKYCDLYNEWCKEIREMDIDSGPENYYLYYLRFELEGKHSEMYFVLTILAQIQDVDVQKLREVGTFFALHCKYCVGNTEANWLKGRLEVAEMVQEDLKNLCDQVTFAHDFTIIPRQIEVKLC